eukprot:TRINITY_DN1721_c0_g1_i1.p2 TRINITY_DN1721_c0_g1~~TRINITY_DN1721_c0_g1_i1.p2  ORF type:complete len:150 (-),score=66.21 TRINITY_DN1721_c0_g1_i1:122-571(-)
MIRRPPRSTHCISSAASDVYKRQVSTQSTWDTGKWYNFDDGCVSEVTNMSAIVSEAAYVLFYQRRDAGQNTNIPPQISDQAQQAKISEEAKTDVQQKEKQESNDSNQSKKNYSQDLKEQQKNDDKKELKDDKDQTQSNEQQNLEQDKKV